MSNTVFKSFTLFKIIPSTPETNGQDYYRSLTWGIFVTRSVSTAFLSQEEHHQSKKGRVQDLKQVGWVWLCGDKEAAEKSLAQAADIASGSVCSPDYEGGFLL